MFCEKCGAKLPDNAVFCDKCGAPVKTGTTPVTAYTVPPVQPTPVKPSALKRFFSVKRNVLITAVAASVLLIAVILLVVFLSMPKKVYLDKYFDIVYSGCDGYATPSVQWNTEALEKIDKKIFGKKSANKTGNSVLDDIYNGVQDIINQSSSLRYYVNITLTYDPQYLSNGDKITVSFSTLTKEFEEKYDVKLALKNQTVTVKGLEEAFLLNPSEKISLSFTGYSGYGKVSVNVPSGDTAIGETGYSARYEARNDGYNVYIIDSEGYSSYTLYYRFDKAASLSEDETITCTVSNAEQINIDLAKKVGIQIPTESTAYKISGLTALSSFNVLEYMTATFSGYSGFGNLSLEAKNEEVKVGAYTLKLSPEVTSSRCRITVYVCDSDGNQLRSVNYTADKYKLFANSDNVTFALNTQGSTLEADYGITLPESVSLSVSGLEQPIDPKPFDRLDISFTGYEGYGVINMSVKEEIYSVGNYTFKLTSSLDTDSWSKNCSLTIVVADASGSNLFTVEYRASGYYDIKANGETVTFKCRTGSSEREKIASQYGIYFEESIDYTVTGLNPTIQIDPRDMLTYTFSGENGSIILEFGLKQAAVTAGAYTINLSVENYVEWSTHYSKLNFIMTDAEGSEVASGYYRASSGRLSEGNTVSVYKNFSADDIAEATGILFNTETKNIIVSTK